MSSTDDKDQKSKEDKESAAYYAQGHHDAYDVRQDYGKPLPSVDPVGEEFSMMKALSFLAVGGVVVGIGFMWFMISGLDKRLTGVEGSLSKVDEKLAPVIGQVKSVTNVLGQVQGEVGTLRGVVNENDRKAKVMELKRALVTIQEVTANSSSTFKGSTIASINALIKEYGGDAEAGDAAAAAKAPAASGEAQASVAPAPGTGDIQLKPEVVVQDNKSAAAAPAAEASAPTAAPAAPEAPAPAATAPAVPAEAPKKKKAAKDDDDDDDN